MNKLKTILLLLVIIAIGGFFAWKYVHKANDDFANEKPSKTFSFTEISDKVINDTISLNKLKDELVAINGTIKKIIKDEKSTTIEIGDATSMSSLVCQCDDRHLTDLTSLQEGSPISVKGKITGFTIDELGIGNTIEMNFVTLNK